MSGSSDRPGAPPLPGLRPPPKLGGHSAGKPPDIEAEAKEIEFLLDQGIEDDAKEAYQELERKHPAHPRLVPIAARLGVPVARKRVDTPPLGSTNIVPALRPAPVSTPVSTRVSTTVSAPVSAPVPAAPPAPVAIPAPEPDRPIEAPPSRPPAPQRKFAHTMIHFRDPNAPAPPPPLRFPPPLPDNGPSVVAPDDTQALIVGLTDELIAAADAEDAGSFDGAATTSRPRVSEPAGESTSEEFVADESRPQPLPVWTWFAGGAVLSGLALIVLLNSGGDAEEPIAVADPSVQPAEAEPSIAPEPSIPDPEPVILPPPEPEPEPALPVAQLEPEPEPNPEDGPQAPTNSKSKAKPKTEPTPAPAPAPAPAPKPSPTPAPKPKPAPTPSGGTAAELLAQARTALAKGQAKNAYSLASQSWAKADSSDAGEVMTLAACSMREKAKAEAALKRVRLLRRPHVKGRCKDMGTPL